MTAPAPPAPPAPPTSAVKLGRKPTGDVRMRKLHPPRAGTIRSYVSRGGVFVISHLRPQQHNSRASDAGSNIALGWELLHQPSMAAVAVESYAGAIAIIRRLQSPPDPSEGEAGRWVILPRPLPLGGQVLFDRASGRWWGRDEEHPVLEEELEAMSALRPLEAFQHEIKLPATTAAAATTAVVSGDSDVADVADANRKTARRRS